MINRLISLFMGIVVLLIPSLSLCEVITVKVRSTKGEVIEKFHFWGVYSQSKIYGWGDKDSNPQIDYEREDECHWGGLYMYDAEHCFVQKDYDELFVELEPEIKIEVFDAGTGELIRPPAGVTSFSYYSLIAGEDTVSVTVPSPGRYLIRANTTFQVEMLGKFDTGVPSNDNVSFEAVSIPTIGNDDYGTYEIVGIRGLFPSQGYPSTWIQEVRKRYTITHASYTITHVAEGETNDTAFIPLLANKDALLDSMKATVANPQSESLQDSIDLSEHTGELTIETVAEAVKEGFGEVVQHHISLQPTMTADSAALVGGAAGALIFAPAQNLLILATEHPNLNSSYIWAESVGVATASILGTSVGLLASSPALGVAAGFITVTLFKGIMEAYYDSLVLAEHKSAAFDDIYLNIHKNDQQIITQLDLQCFGSQICDPSLSTTVGPSSGLGYPETTLHDQVSGCFPCDDYFQIMRLKIDEAVQEEFTAIYNTTGIPKQVPYVSIGLKMPIEYGAGYSDPDGLVAFKEFIGTKESPSLYIRDYEGYLPYLAKHSITPNPVHCQDVHFKVRYFDFDGDDLDQPVQLVLDGVAYPMDHVSGEVENDGALYRVVVPEIAKGTHSYSFSGQQEGAAVPYYNYSGNFEFSTSDLGDAVYMLQLLAGNRLGENSSCDYHLDSLDKDGDGVIGMADTVQKHRESNGIAPKTVVSETGRVWMDRNLGASRVATSYSDTEAFGDLYQWGRDTDGHEKRDSPTTLTKSSGDTPGHGNFIKTPYPDYPNQLYDWRVTHNNDLWQGVDGINNPCPRGFRLPTVVELDAERADWGSRVSAFNSKLKLPAAGNRQYSSGLIGGDGAGFYWSSTVNGKSVKLLSLGYSWASMPSHNRSYGFSVRCIQD